jgi:uncharacterized RDD family membrane protein YckC
MKCPKCGYFGFEEVDRCRNCGYNYSLTAPAALPDLAIRPAGRDLDGPLEDLELSEPTRNSPVAELQTFSRSPAVIAPSELPLFDAAAHDDTPLITRVSPPRHPLAVRRATPEVPRLRSEARSAPVEQSLPDLGDAQSISRPVRSASLDEADARAEGDPSRRDTPAGVVSRALAGALDVLLILGIDFLVVYFTLQVCGLTFADFGILPRAPLAVFLMMLAVGYFVVFTMCGQTLGQMATGIRVVADNSKHPPEVGRAMVRTLAWLLMLAPAGVGLLSVMIDGDRRGLHDRVAATRVVRVRA